VTYEGEVLSIPRILGIKTKDVRAKLGQADDLRSVDTTRTHIAGVVAPRLKALIAAADKAKAGEMAPLDQKRMMMKEQHGLERKRLDQGQRQRADAEAKTRAERFRKGVAGLWDRVTGQHGRIARQNETEAFQSLQRDRLHRNGLIADQLRERQTLQCEIVIVRARYASRIAELHRDLARLNEAEPPRKTMRENFADAAPSPRANTPPPTSHQSRSDQGRGRGGRGQVRMPDLAQ